MKYRALLIAFVLSTAGVMPCSTVEALEVRGIFLPSTGPKSVYSESFWWERNKAEISAYLDDLQAAGINELYPSVFGHGNYFFNTSHALFPQGVVPNRLDIDPLAVLIAEAHQRNMRVIPFFPFLVAGGETYVKQSSGGTVPNPSWYCVNTEGDRGTTLSFDPAHPEVRAYLGHLVEDLLDYDIDGIMLDYIRYLGSHMGYTPLARESFQAKTGVDPMDLLLHPERYSTNIVYCIKPTSWAGKPWYLSTLLSTLNHLHTPFKIVEEKELTVSDLPVKSTILMGAYYDVAEPLIQELNTFVAGGGKVVFLDAPTTAMKKHEATLGPLIGMTSQSRYAGQQARTLCIDAEHPITIGGKESSVICSANALTEIRPDTARTLAHFADGKPAVVLNNYGKGQTVLFNFNMLLNYRGEEGLKLLGNALKWTLASAGTDPGAAKLAELNAAWTQWRCEQVTEVVGMVRGIVDAKKPGLLLGAATTPQRFHVNVVFQDWKCWLDREYINIVYPMNYFGEDQDLQDALDWQQEGIPVSKIVPLLALFRREGKDVLPVTPETLSRQLDLLDAYNVHGAGLFSSMRYAPEIESMLRERWAH